MLDNLALALADEILNLYWQGLSFKDALKKVYEEIINLIKYTKKLTELKLAKEVNKNV